MTNRSLDRVVARVLGSVCALASVASCGAPPSTREERTDATSSALNGGDTHLATYSTTLPASSTVRVFTPTGSCTGSVIALRGRAQTGLVLTAAHCICTAAGGLYGGSANTNIQVVRPGPAGGPETFIANSLRTDVWAWNGTDACKGILNEDEPPDHLALMDLAIITLDRALLPAQFPSLPRAYTSGDFMERAENVNLVYGAPLFPPTPIVFTGCRVPNAIQEGTYYSLGFDRYSGGVFGLGGYRGIRINAQQDVTIQPDIEPGDSGGSLTMSPPDRSTIFGVASGVYESTTDYSRFSPTWNNGRSNGDWINSFLVDADEDGIEDGVDNAPPSMCGLDIYACANPDQADGDNDGIGDIRDNCPASLCAARGWPLLLCYNPSQVDSDGDGTGDACDSCPTVKNGDARIGAGGQLEDADGDGVGNACDNCGKKNGYRACSSTGDCSSVVPSATCLGFGFGKCAGPNGEVCLTSADCPRNPLTNSPYACNQLGAFGRCSVQLDDLDDDGVGGVCDTCPTVKTTNQVTANSNLDNELRKNVTQLGDMCEPVPQMVSRANVGRVKLGTNTNLDPLGSTSSYTVFFQSSGLGTGASPTSVTQTGGMRHCNCINVDGTELPRDACISTVCRPTDGAFTAAAWRTMSTSTSSTLTTLPSSTTTVGQTISATYDASVTCNDNFTHVPGGDRCRLGTQRLVRWNHTADIDRGIPTFTDAYGVHTVGLVLSHVNTTTTTNAARDGVGGMRDTFEYVKTPLTRYVDSTASRAYQNCLLSGCQLVFPPDWVVDPPDLIRTGLTPIDDVNYFARIGLQPDGKLGAVARPADPVFDVTPSMSAQVLDVVTAPTFGFLSPVESGATARARQDGTRPFTVAIATPWRAASERPHGIRVYEDGIMYFVEPRPLPPPPETPHPFGHTRFVPSDRDGARAVYSADALAVFLVGGHRAVGGPTGEVWRYDLESDTWTNALRNELLEATPEDPLALAYDSASETLVAIDRQAGSPNRRILRIDLRSKILRVVAEIPAFANAGKYSLVHAGSGEYLLARQVQGDSHFDIYRFRLASSSVLWLGYRQEIGDLLDDAFATPLGVIAPITRELQGQHDWVVLSTTNNTTTPASL